MVLIRESRGLGLRWCGNAVVVMVCLLRRESIMTVPHPRPRRGKDLDAGVLQPEISSFRLCLAAEGKSVKTIRVDGLII